jgi:asparagine synthetase B (glutamine-hydrolysing)
LAIVDLSAAGHQPMHSDGGRYVMAFNGEIYNHLELRAELEGMDCRASLAMTDKRWRGHSDTETLLAGFEAWGVEATLKKTVGMFAIALWDKQAQTLTLARDRFGEKPLYYGWVGQGANAVFVFGSELKALRAYPGFANPVSREALAQYMRFMFVPAPLSIYDGIYKLEPGCLLTLDRHCEEHSDAAIHGPELHGLPRFARNDGSRARSDGRGLDCVGPMVQASSHGFISASIACRSFHAAPQPAKRPRWALICLGGVRRRAVFRGCSV